MEQQKLRTVLGDAPQDAACAGNKQAGDPLGTLPPCAPLANPYVPFQNEDPARYPIEKGLIRGAAVGLCYMGLGVALYALLSGQQASFSSYLADLAMGVAGGGIVGMILSNISAK